MKEFETLLLGQYIALILSNYIFIPNQRLQNLLPSRQWRFQKQNYWRPAIFLVFSVILSPASHFILYSTGISAIMLLLIYLLETKKKNGYYTLSQLLQIAVVTTAAWLYTNAGSYLNLAMLKSEIYNTRTLVYIFAYLVCLGPANLFIKFLFRFYKFAPGALSDDSLLKAGRFIGNIERTMILSFVLLSQYSAFGFLVAAKSILRLKDEQKQSEYILTGTFLSVGIAVIAGLITNAVISGL